MDGLSSVSVGDAAAGQVVGRDFHFDSVSRQDADVVLAHLPGDRREDFVPSVDLDSEHRARQCFDDLSFDLDLLFLDWHAKTQHTKRRGAARLRRQPHYRSKTASAVRICGPDSVIATVCSKWAASEPSLVEIDHSSSCTITSGPPAVIIGSIANVMPSASSGPRPGAPKFGICGSSCIARPTPWPTRLRTTEKPASSVTVCTALEMSESLLPGRHCSIPASSAACPTSSRRSASA